MLVNFNLYYFNFTLSYHFINKFLKLSIDLVYDQILLNEIIV